MTETLKIRSVETSAPCRIDLGGTLDISTFYHPLRHLNPCTFNIAINLRTRVRILPYKKGIIRVSSEGFKSAEYPSGQAPFDHPLGLMFAIAAYFRAEGVHIQIHSSSPPRSALGGSSAAAVALIAAFDVICGRHRLTSSYLKQTAVLAHVLESSVAGVPCGMQDQLAAAYGGVNAWCWPVGTGEPPFIKKSVMRKRNYPALEKHLALAYCGIPHESRNINSRWVRQFLKGTNRNQWAEIVSITEKFIEALSNLDYKQAASLMNRETDIRRKMTPDVFDDMGKKLVHSARENGCGARFTGAGGGGCIWAIGDEKNITQLKDAWRSILNKKKKAFLLNVKIDTEGLAHTME